MHSLRTDGSCCVPVAHELVVDDIAPGELDVVHLADVRAPLRPARVRLVDPGPGAWLECATFMVMPHATTSVAVDDIVSRARCVASPGGQHIQLELIAGAVTMVRWSK